MVGPSIDCLNNPLGVVRTLFGKAFASQLGSIEDAMLSNWGEKELFDAYLHEQGGYNLVPEINSAPLSAIPANSLVRFRGMVQDMFDPEYYLGAYKDDSGWRSSKYSDITDVPMKNDSETRLCSRRPYYCVPVPGESDWVKEAFTISSQRLNMRNFGAIASTSNHSEKRPRETDDMRDVEMEFLPNNELGDSKRLKEAEVSTDPVVNASQSLDLNMPLGKSTLIPCIVKVYGNADADIKLNDVIEFTGVLAFDPELSASCFSDSSAEDVDVHPPIDEGLCSQLPASRVPRLHSITFRKLFSHRIHEAFPKRDEVDTSVMVLGIRYLSLLFHETPDTLKQMRDSIVTALAHVLGGDHLTAEYLLLHLLSQVYQRSDEMALGKMSLNIFTGPNEFTESSSPLATRIAEAAQSLLPWSHLMPLSLDNLNKGLLAPRKDYALNRLLTGSLQLAEGTYLILDETALNTGQLTSVGIQNIQTLKRLMDFQMVDYDFEYYSISMPTDIPVLIISTVKSRLLPADVVVPVRSTANGSSFAVDDSDIARWRLFLTSVRNKAFSLDMSIEESIQDDIVGARRSDRSLTVNTIHGWLILARLLCFSHGESTLTSQRWLQMREMERLRQERLRLL